MEEPVQVRQHSEGGIVVARVAAACPPTHRSQWKWPDPDRQAAQLLADWLKYVPRPMSRYVTAIVSPLSLNAASDLALRRLAPRVPTGQSVQAYCDHGDLVGQELPTVDVGAISD